jgi:hypothetical protein
MHGEFEKRHKAAIPAYENPASLDLSYSGAHLPHIACIAGNVTPCETEHIITLVQ